MAPNRWGRSAVHASSTANVDRHRSSGRTRAHAADSALARCRGGPRFVLGAARATLRCCLGRHARRRRPRHRRSRQNTRGLPMAFRTHSGAATHRRQRLRDRPNGVAPLDDGSTRPFGGCNVAGDHVSSPAVSFAVAIALLPAMREADGRAVAVVVAAAVGVRLPASPVSARRHVPGMRPLAADKSLARRSDSRAWALCTQSRHLPWS